MLLSSTLESVSSNRHTVGEECNSFSGGGEDPSSVSLLVTVLSDRTSSDWERTGSCKPVSLGRALCSTGRTGQ